MAPCDIKQHERRVGWPAGVPLPGLDGSRANVEQPGEGDLGEAKAGSDLGHISRSELWQRREFDFARRQRPFPTVVRDRVLDSGAELGEGRNLLPTRPLLHEPPSSRPLPKAGTS